MCVCVCCIYLLQEDRQLAPELFLQLGVSSKKGIIHQHLRETQKVREDQGPVVRQLQPAASPVGRLFTLLLTSVYLYGDR